MSGSYLETYDFLKKQAALGSLGKTKLENHCCRKWGNPLCSLSWKLSLVSLVSILHRAYELYYTSYIYIHEAYYV